MSPVSRFLFVVILAVCGWLSVRGQVTPTAGQNYVIEQTPRSAQTTITLGTSYTDVVSSVAYFDGLGRPLQTVQVRASGDASTDIVTQAVSYDAFGRTNQTFLAVPGGSGGTLLASPQSVGSTFYGDANPYAQTVYEPSPLNRPAQQWGAGQNWRNANRKAEVSYRTNEPGGQAISRFTIDWSTNTIYGHLTGNTSQWDQFSAHELNLTIHSDEQGNQLYDYTDLQGRAFRRDVMLVANGLRLTTYYVYDSYERLAAILPPKLYDWFLTNGPSQELSFYSGTTDNPIFKQLAYAFQYDGRGRVIRKHIPGAGWTDLVYDQQDRLVMSQDQQDKIDGYWRFHRYDGLNRVVQTGRLSLTRSADNLRSDFTQVNHQDFPSTVVPANGDLLTQNSYDDYSGSPFTFNPGAVLGAVWNNTTGLLTQTQVKNLESDAWYKSALWYDDKGRVLQQQQQNHLGYTELTNTQYAFNGDVLHRSFTDNATIGTDTYYAYDQLSRPTSVSFTDSDSPFEMARYQYDALGRLSQKKIQPNGSLPGAGSGNSITRTANPPAGTILDQAPDYVEILPNNLDINFQSNPTGIYQAKIGPATVVTSTTALQTLDYRYHLRGWLLGVNVNAAGQPTLDASQHDLFAFGLEYESANYYNGNIGRQRWLSSRQPAQSRQYTYSYDPASRLTGAVYSGASGEDYSLSGISYDNNGNITALTRSSIDQLSYNYGVTNLSNQLVSVTDASSNTAGFADGNTAGDDYAYSVDGQLTKDLNRNISAIQYNLLKLPRQITYNSGKVVSYTYTAGGQKLRMSVLNGDTRDYLTGYQTVNGVFEFLETPEGRAYSPDVYEYYHTDHLGTIRAVYRDSAGVATLSQQTDYDPWGLELSGLTYQPTSPVNRLKFNGKESLAELGIGLLDFGARFYDAQIGRWSVVDPLAEKAPGWSPYRYGFDNPVGITDPTGQFEYSNGYFSEDSKYSTGSMTFEGAYLLGSGDGPGKGGAQQPISPQQQVADRQASYRKILAQSPNLRRVYAGMSITEKAAAVGGAVDAIESDNATNFAIGGIVANTLRSLLGGFFIKTLQTETAEAIGGMAAEEGPFAYRSLTSANAESLASGNGIFAKAPEGSWTLEEHLIRGSSPKSFLNDPWIATSTDINVARSFSSGNGLIKIDLSKIPASSIQQGWLNLPRSSAGYHYSIWQQEVSILGHIPQSAIQIIK